jgi:endonuclease IV
MEFRTSYYSPMDREYISPIEVQNKPKIEQPIMGINELGTTTTEIAGQQTLLQGVEAEIRKGVGKIELATQMGGPTQPTGAQSYGEEAREAFRELSKANLIQFTSVHAPTQINGLSGFDPQQGFSDQARKMAVDEINHAIRFAAEATQGGAVVVHSSEYTRPISEADWAKETLPDGTEKYKFTGYEEEPGRSVVYLVDDRTGRIISDVRKNLPIYRARYKTADRDYVFTDRFGVTHHVKKGDYLDLEGRPTDDPFERVPLYNETTGRFYTEKYYWKDFERETKEWNKKHPEQPLTTEEYFVREQLHAQISQLKGYALYYQHQYQRLLSRRERIKKAMDFYRKVEAATSEEEKWRLKRQWDKVVQHEAGEFIPWEEKYPLEMLKDAFDENERQLKYTHQSSSSFEAQAEDQRERLEHIKPMQQYALEQSYKTIAETGLRAMEESHHNPHAKRDVFISIENWDPQAFGSHPEEAIKLIKGGREKMIELLTKPKIPDPYMRLDEHGNVMEVDNPYYNKKFAKNPKLAEEEAKKHVKMTLDTEHLGLWRKNFVPMPGETKEQTDKRFYKWMIDEVEKMAKEDIIGHVHLVDGIDGSHSHLPPGQGKYPLKDIIKTLKKYNFNGTVVSEGHSENRRFGTDRQITSAWRYFDVPIYGTRIGPTLSGGWGPPGTWTDVQYSYFGRTYPPFFIFGAYVPSNDWTLWSQVPME